jgi:hypothetical protein
MISQATARKLQAKNPDLSARDMRDLLMEHGAGSVQASEMTAGRLASEHAAR